MTSLSKLNVHCPSQIALAFARNQTEACVGLPEIAESILFYRGGARRTQGLIRVAGSKQTDAIDEYVTSCNEFDCHIAGQNQQWQNLFISPQMCIIDRVSRLRVLKSLYGYALQGFNRFAHDLPSRLDSKV